MARPRRERPRRRWIRTLEGCEKTVGCAGRRDETGRREEGRRSVSCVRVPCAYARAVSFYRVTQSTPRSSDLARSARRPLLCACARTGTRLPRRRKVYNVAIRNRIIRAEEEMLAEELSLIDELVLPTASLPSAVP